MRSLGRCWSVALFVGAVVILAGCDGDGTTSQQLQGEYRYFFSDGGGTLQILGYGGEGLNGDGGEGGEFEIYAYAAGDILVLPYGRIDTTFQVPTGNIELGDNPRTISADTTLLPDAITRRILGDDGTTDATGLHVLPGVTLTLRPNIDLFGDGSLDESRVSFDDGVLVEGTIMTGLIEFVSAGLEQLVALDTVDLDINAENIVVRATGVIDTRGQDGATGGTGGAAGDVDFYSSGTMVTQGTILAYGGNGDSGGAGGDVDLSSSDYAVFNTGPVSTYGGTGSAGAGGNAGDIHMNTDDTGGGVHNSGMLLCYGGDGATLGGDGGDVDLEGFYFGPLVNSGDIDASGGDCTSDGNGGQGGYLYFYCGGSYMRATGTLTARGGDGAGAGIGGSGDGCEFYLQDEDYIEEEYSVSGMFIGCDIDVSGGDGASGGDGGDVYFYPDQDEMWKPGMQPTILAGYAGIDMSGGNGSVNGGDAYDGWHEVYNDGGYSYSSMEWVGSIQFQVPFDGSGGNGGTGYGGTASNLEIYNDYLYGDPVYDRVVRNTADIDLSGGNGGTDGGNGGRFYMYDYYRVVNEGNVATAGGNAGSGLGGAGDDIDVVSDNLSEQRGNIDCSGGNSVSGEGGQGGDVWIAGRETICHGDFDASGGDTISGEFGGAGGDIDIFSTDVLTDGVGFMYVEGGGGSTDGENGGVWCDGIQLDLIAGGADL